MKKIVQGIKLLSIRLYVGEIVALKLRSLKMKMLLSFGGLVFVAFALTIGVVAFKARTIAEENAVRQAEEIGFRYSHEVGRELEQAMSVARVLAQTFEEKKASGQVPDRVELNRIMKKVLTGHPSFLAVWTVWEPNALDGNDGQWAGKDGHDDTGRFVPYWSRGESGISLAPLQGYDVPGDGDFYLFPMKTGKETVMEPYGYTVDGREVVMTTFCVPMRWQGKLVGVVGVDLTLDFIRDKFEHVRIFEGKGYLSLISNNGHYVSHPDAKRLGRSIKDTDPWALTPMEEIRRGRGVRLQGYSKTVDQEVLRVLEPLTIGASSHPWATVVSVPMSAILADANGIMQVSGVMGMVAVGILLALIYLMISRVTTTVNQGMSHAQVMAGGDLRRRVKVERQDEIGALMAALNQISEDLGKMIQSLSSDVGDLTLSSRDLAGVSEQMSQGAEETGHASEGVAAAAEEMSAGMASVAAAMEQASGNITTVAGAAEEMTATIQEVSKNTDLARNMADKAAAEAGAAHDQIQELGDAAREIGNVTDTITDISEQTNLLALNATIEAARAGSAGKGFAVVAMEIKELARLTSQATESIQAKIEGIQSATSGSVEAIQSVTQIIQELNETSSGVAAAVEEQTVTTQEIAANVTQVSQGFNQISGNIGHSTRASQEITTDIAQVSRQAGEIITGSRLVRERSRSLLELSQRLDQMVNRFKV